MARSGRSHPLSVAVAAAALIPSSAFAQQDGQFPPADLQADEGGPVLVAGDWSYTSSIVRAHFVEPVAVLLNISRYVAGDNSDWVPVREQAIGRITSPMSNPPVSFEVPVPFELDGARIDVDNDGETDEGVQIYGLSVASNLNGDSYLQQFDQTSFDSFLRDPSTGVFREGTFLVHAADDAQGFPSGFGEDGIYFTDDDPVVGLPAGWTLATLSADGSVAFDRSRTARMDTREQAAVASPDFSEQGILESYNSLIELLEVRYAYTELRGLDWEAIRAEHEADVVAADTEEDYPAYFLALTELARSIRDSHVDVTSSDAAVKSLSIQAINDRFAASLGAKGAELDDGRFIVTYVVPDGPASGAGWQFGTEIVSVNGLPVAEHIESIPLPRSVGTDEAARLSQVENALKFAEGTSVEVEFRQPGIEVVESQTMTAIGGLEYPSVGQPTDLIRYEALEGGYWYVTWHQFAEPDYVLAVWRRLFANHLVAGAPGVLIDLRGNRGGNVELLYTMASYFFAEDEPASHGWIESYVFDGDTGDLVKDFKLDAPIFTPDPALLFNGAVVVLVDENSASAGEYFPQFLQYHDRALVVGQNGSSGAGGFLERVALPGAIQFDFTKSRTFFAGTEEVNLEGKGVTLDVRVPTSEENERAKAEGGDPVLDAGLAALRAEGLKIAGEQLRSGTWKLTRIAAAPGATAQLNVPEGLNTTFMHDGTLKVAADCNNVMAAYEIGAASALSINPTISTLAACPSGSLGEDFVSWLSAAQMFQTDGSGLFISTDAASGVVGLLFERADF